MLHEAVVQVRPVGAVIGWRYLSRRATTNPVSRIGTASTSSGKNRATVAAVFSSPSTETAASTNPSSIAPESPMKIRAGKKLWRRKPSVAPRTIAERTPAFGLPSESAITANVPPAIAAHAGGEPVEAVEEVDHVHHRDDPDHGQRRPDPRRQVVDAEEREREVVDPDAEDGGIEPATTWPPSFSHQRRPRKSSIAPTTVATAAPTSSPRTGRVRSRNASAGTMIPKNIARPPSRGIGIRWTRRSSGTSTAPSRRAIPATAGVSTTTITSASAAP